MLPLQHTLAVHLLMAIAVPQTHDPAVCSEIANLAGHAANDFRALRGALKSHDTEHYRIFVSKRLLPGAAECEINASPAGSEFECVWYRADRAELDMQFGRLSDSLVACFPNAQLQQDPEPATNASQRVRPATTRIRMSESVHVVLRKWTSSITSARARISLMVVRAIPPDAR